MSLDATRWAWMQQGLRPLQKLILLALADRADDSDQSFPSHERLIADTGADQKTIWQALKVLQERHLISDTGERKGSTGRVVVWQLHGVERRPNHSENGRIKSPQKRKHSKNGMIPKTEPNHSENGRMNHSENGMQNLSGNQSGTDQEESPPAQAQNSPPKSASPERNDGLPKCVPRDVWETYEQEQSLKTGRPMSIAQKLACWKDLAAMDAEGYDPRKILDRCVQFGFRTFDRRPETQKAPAATNQKPGLSTNQTQRTDYGQRTERQQRKADYHDALEYLIYGGDQQSGESGKVVAPYGSDVHESLDATYGEYRIVGRGA